MQITRRCVNFKEGGKPSEYPENPSKHKELNSHVLLTHVKYTPDLVFQYSERHDA